jgi:hypothetical protein
MSNDTSQYSDETLDLFQYQPTPEDLRDQALKRVARRPTSTGWMDEALEVIRVIAEGRPEFTVTRARTVLDKEPPEPRAWGAVMIKAQKLGWIVPTQRHINQGSHARPVRVWRSLLSQNPG